MIQTVFVQAEAQVPFEEKSCSEISREVSLEVTERNYLQKLISQVLGEYLADTRQCG